MLLSPKLILWHLRQKYAVQASDPFSSEPCLKCALCHCTESVPAGGFIYIVSEIPEEFLRSPLRSMMVVTAPRSKDTLRHCPNICVIPDADPVSLLEFIEQIFQKYEEWNQALFESRMMNGSIQSLLDMTSTIIPNPMVLIGMDFTIIASRGTSLGDLPSSVLGSTEETADLILSLKQDPNYADAFHRVGYFYYSGNGIAVPSLCVNIRRFDRTLYRLLITQGEVPLDDTFGFLLEYLARIINHALSTNIVDSHDTRHQLHQIFHTILTDSSADYVEVSRRLTDYGWLSSHYYLCIFLKTELLDYKNLTHRSIISYIENIIPASCALEHKGNIVVYINLDLCQLSESDIEQKLASFIRDSFLNAGYSRRMLGHFNFHRQYTQASLSLQVGSRKFPHRWIHHFNDIALTYLLEETTKKLPAYMVCHEKLLNLKYESENGQSQLYQTLRCYLKNHQNATKTAGELFIHRSTLLYRLDRITHYLKTDLSDPDEILYLLLSFRLIDMEEQK
mgnify:CR=1 FL=1